MHVLLTLCSMALAQHFPTEWIVFCFVFLNNCNITDALPPMMKHNLHLSLCTMLNLDRTTTGQSRLSAKILPNSWSDPKRNNWTSLSRFSLYCSHSMSFINYRQIKGGNKWNTHLLVRAQHLADCPCMQLHVFHICDSVRLTRMLAEPLSTKPFHLWQKKCEIKSPSPTRVCLPCCIVEKRLVWFLAVRPRGEMQENPQWVPLHCCAATTEKKLQLKAHCSSLCGVRCRVDCQRNMFSNQNCFPPTWHSLTACGSDQRLMFPAASPSLLWLSPCFVFSPFLYSSMSRFQKTRNLICAVKRFLLHSKSMTARNSSLLVYSKRETAASASASAPEHVLRLTRSLKRS